MIKAWAGGLEFFEPDSVFQDRFATTFELLVMIIIQGDEAITAEIQDGTNIDCVTRLIVGGASRPPLKAIGKATDAELAIKIGAGQQGRVVEGTRSALGKRP